MSLTIYGDSQSGNCLKVLWTAKLLGLDHTWIEIDVLADQAKTPEFLAINPAAQVPCVLLSDGRMLAQSNAIIMHLAEGSRLIPTAWRASSARPRRWRRSIIPTSPRATGSRSPRDCTPP